MAACAASFASSEPSVANNIFSEGGLSSRPPL
jgi:hypothetical protein